MPRRPLPINGHGEIRTHRHGDSWRAIANYRGRDGKTKPIERSGPTAKSATKRLRAALNERQNTKVDLTERTTFRELADEWLKRIKARREDTTYDTYKRTLKNLLLDRIGDLRIPELTVATLEEVFEELHDEGHSANYRRSARTVVRGALSLAVRKGPLDSNPVRELSPIEGGAKKVRALTADERVLLLAKLDELTASQYFRHSDLPSSLRFMLGTGVRIGEALAVRWKDLNLTDKPTIVDGETIPPRSVSINGNIVSVTGVGLTRHDGKTENAVRYLALPEFLVTMLAVRRDADAPDDEPVFPSETLGWRHPNNWRRSWRSAREHIYDKWALDFGWVTPHAFRKTAATILDDEQMTARQIADQLGHARPSMTQDVYMGRGQANPAAAAALDAAYSRS